MKAILKHGGIPECEAHCNFVVTRPRPDRCDRLAKADRTRLKRRQPFGHLLAGRVRLAASVGE